MPWPVSCHAKHLDTAAAYARISFMDFSSAFNTETPERQQDRLSRLNAQTSTCRWITDFLSHRKQVVKPGKHISGRRRISDPSRLRSFSTSLHSVHQQLHPSHQSYGILMVTDDALIRLTSEGNESVDRLVQEQATRNHLPFRDGRAND